LAFLPLHAAGVYGEGNSESILDYAISSYTPSIGFLIERSTNNHSIDENLSGLLLASQPDTPGTSPIPRTTTEVRPIYESALKHGVRALKLEGDDLTVEGVLEKMETLSSVHLACHVSEDAKGPLQSKFLLHQGSLDLGTIIQKNLKNADFAFLSACQPNVGEISKAGEVPLAVGMLAAGYRRVVVATGPIQDSHAADITGDFYDYLLAHQTGGNGTFDGSQSAYALHYAVQKLRQRLDNSEESLLALMSYAHFGL
jgi:CHAT domain-containing protein